MDNTFIELGRRFKEYRTDETPEILAQRSYAAAWFGHEQGIAWDELLQNRLVVILGEPGSGKTWELKAKCRRLRPTSFFLSLDRLVSEDISSILDEEEICQFEKWKTGDDEATFFLDAVDESKIQRDDDFFIALDRMKKAVGPSLMRSRFVISSRISEWRPQTDREGVLQRLGVDQTFSKYSAPNDQRLPTRRNSATSLGKATEQPNEEESAPPIMVVSLLPLVPSQVKNYASACGVRDPQGFISALEENNAWAFAGRPLDVSHLYAYWNDKGQLSSLTNLTEYMVDRLLAEVANKEKQDPLPPAQARLGAEYLAAAVILCRCLRIRVSDNAGLADENLISPATVLPKSWLPLDRRAMTDRALFDAASHGAISFHHRYHTEYLAAAWIERLMAHNCGLDALEDLLFASVDGQRVLRPTLAPVAAWLVKSGEEPWRHRLAEWLLESAPEIHLVHGDPAALPLDYRRRILSNLIERYKGRSQVMLNWDRAALARLANTGLVDDLNRYLLDVAIAEDLRSDLLMVVREGKLLACVPAALTLLADPTTTDNLKSYAATVVRDVGNTEHRRQLAQSWAALPEISNNLLGCLCEALFPQAIAVDELLALLRRSHTIGRYRHDLPYVIRPLLKRELDASKAEELLWGLLELLVTPPLMDRLKLSEQFLWLTSLIPACLQHLLAEATPSDKAYDLATDAILLLEQVEWHGHLDWVTNEKNEDIQSVQQAVAFHEELRRRLFWERVAKYRRKKGKEPKVFEVDTLSTLVPLSKEDLKWLLSEAGASLPMPDRRLAMEAAADLLRSAQQPLLTSVWRLLSQTGGNPALVAVCRQHVWSRLRDPVMRLWFRHIRHKLLEKWWWSRRFHDLSQIRQKLHDKWWLWRHLGDLRKGLYPVTLAYFARLAAGDNHNQYGGSNWDKVSEEWGPAIAAAARQGCTVAWRHFSPLLPYEKEQRNSVDLRVVVGLVGLQTLWRGDHLDFSALSDPEVDQAVCYACNELNSFPEWFPALSAARPVETARTLGRAISGEWNFPAELEHVHDVAAKLAWIPNPVEAVTQVFLARLQIGDPSHPKILEYALATLLRSGSSAINELQSLAVTRVRQYAPEQVQWLTWMNTWLQLDALPALDYLESMLLAESSAGSDTLIIRLCAAMSGRQEERRQVSNPSFLELPALLRFIPLVNQHVRSMEDIERANQGVYSPDRRDFAQEFRSRLWEGLKNRLGPEADEVLRTLLADPAMADKRDWILHLLDGRKSLRVDDVAWKAGDIRVFAEHYCSEPRSDYQLFRLVSRLLRNIKSHVERSENAANRLQVRSGDLEKDLQGFLTEALARRSLGWFAVTQESTVDLEQRPDLRVERPGLNPVPIEIKLADLRHWTMPKLLERLENQLIGQYLRPANVRHGIYVLGNTDPKRHWKIPGTSDKLNFEELVQCIRERAASLQAKLQEGVDGIEVIGIDFSDPRER